MWPFSCLRSRKQSDRADCHRPRTSPRERASFRPRLEALEERCLPSFSAPTFYSAGTAPQAVVTADLNGDGKLDLVTADRGTYDTTGTYAAGGGISVLLGTTSVKKGSTTSGFAPAQNYDVGPAGSVVVGDINRDGKPDGVAGNGSVLLNNGDGTFRPGPGVAGGVGAYPTLTDVNGDGRLDLIAFNSYSTATSSSTVRVLPGNGDGTFQAGSTYTIPDYLRAVKVGNFNGDGKPDLVVANASSLFLLPGNGDGTFGPAQDFQAAPGGATVASPTSFAIGDFNADGSLDLAVAGQGATAGEGCGIDVYLESPKKK
jgi:hypothetical protein